MGERMQARMMECLRRGGPERKADRGGTNVNQPGELLKLWRKAGGQPSKAGEAEEAVQRGSRFVD